MAPVFIVPLSTCRHAGLRSKCRAFIFNNTSSGEKINKKKGPDSVSLPQYAVLCPIRSTSESQSTVTAGQSRLGCGVGCTIQRQGMVVSERKRI